MSKNTDDFDIDRLVAWAESDEPTKSGVTTAQGDEAARQGRALLHLGGRPSLGAVHAQGEGRSPRRQVRLPQELNHELDQYVQEEKTSASEVIRLALSEYFGHHRQQPASI
ncbi:ribbon-helix-helix protein, CopG family [Bifidobacterium tibiigranuli]|jgi:hypothetical protein|uniref:ribbon-helix-helix protein, CopG family n=1 Tax=Bifidobacterium tibiigranuli TaxID=2172043 RepID=UPI0026EF6CD5|nr:ribbon-helix-helix protein, CopG family [Bifidobacterium tibiigranuli]MCI1650094.1 ribbon-helix-helix protein, CopG family [Bifidobacterium tibiigranuli]MCI1674649.1 ribbon-helix-helix protein, CopG family [Bifidobacterium tibiigranuli]MCI1713958.1 ribbon-helix-helix protein, CopG family [Bifidobacterium tibiigranuli]MCI1834679.1 ribbon-helix-helix protein, CopG family [Bifidobacterium tibiigranuli]MCI2186131.1 ribbon-helix-helix protein, CopG family [Bifidobacterium tibiigranuli]